MLSGSTEMRDPLNELIILYLGIVFICIGAISVVAAFRLGIF